MGRGRPPKKENVVENNNSDEIVTKPTKKITSAETAVQTKDEKLDALLKGVLKGSKMLADNKDKYVVKEWFDTGSMVLNLLISGDMYRGVPDNRITQFVGDQSSAKTYITRKIMNSAMKTGWKIFNFITEGDADIGDYERANMDISRILMVEDVDTTKKVIHKLTAIVTEANPEPKWLINIDSIGNLSSTQEVNNAVDGKDTQDRSRERDLKSMFRIILPRAFDKRIPLILINHEYESQGFIPQKIVSGGKGSRLASTTIVEFSKSQLKIGETVVGIKIRAKTPKNRLAIEGKVVTFAIFHKSGISRHWGIDELLFEYNIAKKIKIGTGNGFEIDGEKYALKDLLSNPEFYDEVIKKHKINELLSDKFSYKNENDTNADIEAELDSEILTEDTDGK